MWVWNVGICQDWTFIHVLAVNLWSQILRLGRRYWFLIKKPVQLKLTQKLDTKSKSQGDIVKYKNSVLDILANDNNLYKLFEDIKWAAGRIIIKLLNGLSDTNQNEDLQNVSRFQTTSFIISQMSHKCTFVASKRPAF